jgi:hypothetical protein
MPIRFRGSAPRLASCCSRMLGALLLAGGMALPQLAVADVTISSDATQNMNCADGVCAPTAADAVLNVGDLQNLLASGDVTVTTTGAGVQANNITAEAKFGWSANTLALDAFQSVTIGSPVVVEAGGGLSILTNDGGSGGVFSTSGKGHVTFKKLSSALTINGASYRLVKNIAALAEDIAKKSDGNFALAGNYDASQDSTYSASPIPTSFVGTFEGLGNTISNLTINDPSDWLVGLFAEIGKDGGARNLGLSNASVNLQNNSNTQTEGAVGALVGELEEGSITGCYSSGSVTAPRKTVSGGLIGVSVLGTVILSHSSASVASPSESGGLIGISGGTIESSYATGSVRGGNNSLFGGLAGGNSGMIINSYARGKAGGGIAGGLVGENIGTIASSYSTGAVKGSRSAGGLIGEDDSVSGNLSDTYWDTDTSGISDPSQGAGNIPNDPGITGLTTAQFQSGLPSGFDPVVWGEDPNVNNGFPYLLANPPRK